MQKVNGDVIVTLRIPEGSKIKFKEEKQMYTVISSNRFFAVCTKPFNLQKTVLYTIVDFVNKIRGPENLVFGMGAETKEECDEMLDRLTIGESDVSHRRDIPLNVEFYLWNN